MKDQETKNKIIASIQRLSNVEEINDSNTLDQIGISSLKFIRLVVDIEKQCGIRFDDSDIDAKLFLTVGDLVNYVENKYEKNLQV